MQTFLPYPSFERSVKCLDWRRLGKQRVEAMQLLNVLDGGKRGWANHPAAKMWRGYSDALKAYMNCCILEWINRGYKNTMSLATISDSYELPYWFGDDKFHSSHRSNLLRKDSVYYGQFGWTEKNDLVYVWPEERFFEKRLTGVKFSV